MLAATYEVLIDGAEVARRLGVSRKTVERWVQTKIVPSYRFGHRCVRFDFGEVRSALSRFERLAFRRLPRGRYQPRRKNRRFEAVQLELEFPRTDLNQLLLTLPVAAIPGEEPSELSAGD